MSHRILLGGAAAVALLVAGCGSSSSSSSSGSSPSSSSPSASGKKGPVLPRTYAVSLKGASEVPAAAPKGVGKAVISIRTQGAKGKEKGQGSKGQVQLCWKFSGLTGFDKPTAAHIHSGAAGAAGAIVVPLGGAFTPSGCTPAASNVVAAIEASPKAHYVNVHSKKFPNGAVRAQL